MLLLRENTGREADTGKPICAFILSAGENSVAVPICPQAFPMAQLHLGLPHRRPYRGRKAGTSAPLLFMAGVKQHVSKCRSETPYTAALSRRATSSRHICASSCCTLVKGYRPKWQQSEGTNHHKRNASHQAQACQRLPCQKKNDHHVCIDCHVPGSTARELQTSRQTEAQGSSATTMANKMYGTSPLVVQVRTVVLRQRNRERQRERESER